MKNIETCNNDKCRYNNNTSCSLDKIISTFKNDSCACISCCSANNNSILNKLKGGRF